MKVDKIMMILYRIICSVVALVIILGFAVSCFGSPITACAIDERTARMIADWREDIEQEFQAVEGAILEDIKNGTLDRTSEYGQYVLQRGALQYLLIQSPEFYAIYHAADLVIDGIPDGYFDTNPTTDISGGGGSGFYYSRLDGQLHIVNLVNSPPYSPNFATTTNLSYTLCSSDEFTVRAVAVGDSIDYYTQSGNNLVYSGYALKRTANTSGDGSLTLSTTGYFNFDSVTKTGQFPIFAMGAYCVISSGNPVYLDTNVFSGFTSASSLGNSASFAVTVGWGGVSVSLPDDTIVSERPWDYYNQDILPLLEDLPDKYVVFPDGYYPSIPEPTEPPTTPNGGIYIDKQFNIGINIFVPTDSNGEPITDTNGEKVTETAYITETYPTDAEYNFMIPTLEPLRTYQATMPNIDLSPFTDGFAFIWSATENIFTRSGFMPVVIACLGLAVVAYIIWKVGG